MFCANCYEDGKDELCRLLQLPLRVSFFPPQAKSEEQLACEKEWLQAGHMWLAHRGGFTAVMREGEADAGRAKVRVLQTGEILTVDEDDLEKVAAMFRGCRADDMPPHVFAAAQSTHRCMLASRRDRAIVFLGRTGSNPHASRFVSLTSLDFDGGGALAAASVQILLPDLKPGQAPLRALHTSLSTSARTSASILLLDTPGADNPMCAGQQSGAPLSKLLSNYLQERLQAMFHEALLVAPRERYSQEGITLDDGTEEDWLSETVNPGPMVELLDKAPQNTIVRSSQADLRECDRRGLLWEQIQFCTM
ncbi:hypothetical protein HF086_015672 [Spodoptera exigua]|uniref:Uncharacterized protein n=1 Tax=Spodoptera exigua TaxID=7107 RepID=A0A922MVM0_SPOEX|nr:hypothetical protein HF086_015672 [Spodoptera exigua]